jgi:hypothetical protein
MKGAKRDFLGWGRANREESGRGRMATSKPSSSVHESMPNVRPAPEPDAAAATCALSELICPKPVLITFRWYRRIQSAILTGEGELVNHGG